MFRIQVKILIKTVISTIGQKKQFSHSIIFMYGYIVFDEKTNNIFNGERTSYSNTELISYVVDARGDLNIPFIGNINVKDLTINQAREKIEKSLNKYLNNISVLVRFVSNKITVLGEVNNPGQFMFYDEKVNVFQAIGFASGINANGNLTNITLVREKDNNIKYYTLDLTKRDIAASAYYYLLPNDVIIVNPVNAKYREMRGYYLNLAATVLSAANSFFNAYLLSKIYNKRPNMSNKEDIFQNDISFKAIYLRLLSFKKYYIYTIVILLIGAFLINRYSIPKYRNTATVYISDNKQSNFLASKEDMMQGLGFFGNTKIMDNETEILKSFSLLKKTVTALDIKTTYVTFKSGTVAELFMDSPFTRKKVWYDSSPIKVVIDQSFPQAIYLKIFVKILSEDQFYIETAGSNIPLYNYIDDNIVSYGNEVVFRGKFNFGDEVKTRYFNFTVQKSDYLM
ncbi:MAG: hypothetical protein HC906_01945 [Bacteroidales bacterium]|nr:hypothetical protein [Bacteroidales bacterium]